MSYKPPMGDPAFLQKKLKTASNPNVGKKVSNVEAVVYTGASSAMMDLVRHNEPSVKQQPGELFRRVRPTTVANFVEQQVMEQRRQQYGEGGFGGGEDRTLEQYRQGIEPLEEHRDLLPARQNNNRNVTEYAGVAPTSTSYSNGPTPRTSRGTGGETVYRYEPGNGDFEIQNFNPSPPRQQQQRAPSSQGLLQGPQGGLVYIDRNASGAQRPPSRTSTAGDPSFYSSAPASNRSVKGVPNNVVTPLAKHEQRDADTVSRYNNTIASSLRPEMSDVASRAGTTQGMGIANLGRGRVQQPISNDIIVQGPIKRPLPKAPGLSNAQHQQLLRAQNSDVGDLTTNDGGEVLLEGGELPLSQREMLILDVRDKEDYDKCHIIGAFHYPQIRLAHATNPYSIPEILRFKNKKNHIIVLYDLEEEITVAKKMGNVFFEKGADNVFVMAGGLREFVQTHNHLIVGECPVPVVAKSSRLGAYGADKSTLGSYANRSVAGGVVAGGGGGSRAGTGVGGAVAGRRAVSSTRAGGSSTLGGGSRVPQGLSSSLARR